MKKNIFITFLMFSFSVLMVNAELSLTTTAIKNYKDQGYIVSDNVTTYGECSNMVKKYNTEYPSYKRSECFKDGEGYKYFICQTSQSCEVAGGTQSSSSSSSSTSTISTQAGVVSGENSSSSSSTTTSAVVPNKEKLDKFVTKIESLKSTMTDEKFEATLTAVLAKLEKLSTKYSSNTTIAPMLAYLKTSIAELKNKATQDKDVDNFFCELTDSCDVLSTQSCKYVGTRSEGWYDFNGKLIKYDNCGGKTSATGSINTTEEIINLYVSGGILACGNPEKNNYTTHGAEKGVVKIQRGYCEEKGGYVWTMCSGKATNVKTLKSIKNNDTFVCSNTQVQISTGSQIGTGITSSTISNSNDNKYLLYSNLSVVGSSIDFGVIDGGILPIGMNKEYSTEKKVITLKNVQKSDNPKLSSKNIVVTLASADQYGRLKEITLPNIKINNECSGKEIISGQTCNVEVTFIATDKFYSISPNMALIISGDTQFESEGDTQFDYPGDNKYIVGLKGKVNGFCQGEGFSRDGLTRPENVCSTAKIDSGCYSTVAFSITKVLDKCIDTQPTSTTVGTWIGNNLYNSQKRTEKKSDVCYAGDGGNFNFSANNTVNWDSYTCMRRWAIPEIESYQLIKYPSISLNRNYSDKGITFSRTTKDTDSVQRSCKHSNGKTYGGVGKIYQGEYFTSWEQFHKDGFSSGTWNCTWNLSFGNQTKVETETVTIK